jgi:hypothetical protein
LQNFIRPLRNAYPAVIDAYKLDDFIDDVFGNILDLRECNKRLLEVMYVRQREQAPVIQRIGDIFLETATIFRLAYPTYVGHLPLAEKRMKDEIETNPEFRLFLEVRRLISFSFFAVGIYIGDAFYSNGRDNLQVVNKKPSDWTSNTSLIDPRNIYNGTLPYSTPSSPKRHLKIQMRSILLERLKRSRIYIRFRN